jgi:hypothetical protein
VKSRRRPPKLPTKVWSPLGPVPVLIVDHIAPMSKEAPEDVDDFGGFDPKRRVIEVLRSLDPWQQWQSFRHEWCHMVLFDAGMHNLYNDERQEVLCDVIGTALAAEMRNG